MKWPFTKFRERKRQAELEREEREREKQELEDRVHDVAKRVHVIEWTADMMKRGHP